ncbi:MAG: galactokinase [Clostridia bacterium]|nr:galactokinase [Clostridia bacterium]
MKITELKTAITGGTYDKAFASLYGADFDKNAVYERYTKAVDSFVEIYGDKLTATSEVNLFSVPGRSEIAGNHTDHNHGKVVAAGISLDIIAVAAKVDGNEIRIKSEGFDEDICDISTCETVVDGEKYRASAIIRGMCDGYNKNGYKIGGYYAYTTSSVLKGSGLSSSAAFEVMVGNILNHFYNDGTIDAVEIAKIAQYSENVHFGKPCGLMDQTACAVGSFVAIDFEDPKKPIVEKLPFDLTAHGYSLCIVNTGGNHADLNEDYASVPAEMKAVAKYFGKEVLRNVDKNEIIANIPVLRETVGDRAIMRALHFCNENVRVGKITAALKEDDIEGFLKGVKASGLSSSTMLQNTYTVKNVTEQGISLALAVAGQVLDSKPGTAYRVHGGGFAGTMQAFVPNEYLDEFNTVMKSVFGEDSAYVLKVRPYGAVKLEALA